jgi:hypothetical protein
MRVSNGQDHGTVCASMNVWLADQSLLKKALTDARAKRDKPGGRGRGRYSCTETAPATKASSSPGV